MKEKAVQVLVLTLFLIDYKFKKLQIINIKIIMIYKIYYL